jgi:hypothetical protein
MRRTPSYVKGDAAVVDAVGGVVGHPGDRFLLTGGRRMTAKIVC